MEMLSDCERCMHIYFDLAATMVLCLFVLLFFNLSISEKIKTYKRKKERKGYSQSKMLKMQIN